MKLQFGDKVRSKYFKKGLFLERDRKGTCVVSVKGDPDLVDRVHVSHLKKGWKSRKGEFLGIWLKRV